MTRFVIDAGVARRLAEERAEVAEGHQLVAPALLRSQLVDLLYQAARRGELTRKEADAHLDFVRGLKIRLLGDRVLQRVSWKVADQLGWPDTYTAEYLALTQLQADAFVTLDADLAAQAATLVTVAPYDALLQAKSA